MLYSFMLALLLIAATPTLPAIPLDTVQVGEVVGMCDTKEVVIRFYVSSTGKEQARYLYNEKLFAVFVPPLVFALRADGKVMVFNPTETGDGVCSTLDKYIDKAI